MKYYWSPNNAWHQTAAIRLLIAFGWRFIKCKRCEKYLGHDWIRHNCPDETTYRYPNVFNTHIKK